MTTWELIQTYSNEAILKSIESREHAIEIAQRDIQTLRDELTVFKSEQERRNLVSYFEKHPQLMPFAVGDKVMITKSIAYKYGGEKDSVGKVITVKSISLARANTTAVSFGVKAVVSMSECSQMRRAYVESETYAT